MSVTVLIPAVETKLIQLASVKSRLAISGSGEDLYLTELIEEASQAIVTYLRRSLARQSYVETRGGTGMTTLLLTCSPIESVEAITLSGAAVTGFSIHNAGAGTLFHPDGWNWTAQLVGIAGDPRPGTERPDYSIQYIAGYLLPGQVSTWTASGTWSLGSWVRPATAGLTPMLFQVTDAGTGGATEPAWPTTTGAEVVDGGTAFMARPAQELLPTIREAAAEEVMARYREGGTDSRVKKVGIAGIISVEFADDNVEATLRSGRAQRLLRSLRSFG